MNRLDDIDAVLFDIGGTLVVESPPATPLSQLHAEVLPGVVQTLNELAEHHRIAAVTNTASMREADVRRLLEPWSQRAAGDGRHVGGRGCGEARPRTPQRG